MTLQASASCGQPGEQQLQLRQLQLVPPLVNSPAPAQQLQLAAPATPQGILPPAGSPNQGLQTPQEVSSAIVPTEIEQPPSMDAITAKIQNKIAGNPAAVAIGEEDEQEDLAEEAGKGQGSAFRKKPASAKHSIPKVMKKPSGKAVTCKPPLPSIDAGVTHYKGGKIYISQSKKCFRIMLDAKNYASEVKERWVGSKPTQQAWVAALRRIDQGF